jgi:uncharacterized protein YjbI with pentapeptide repeats
LLFGFASQAIAADARQEGVVQKGSVEWNAMREKNPAMHTDLSGAALKGRRLRKIDFSQTSLVGADLSQSDFGRSEFRDADLHGAKLDGSVLVGGRFTGANLNQASLAGASCSDADFSGAKMASTVLRRADCPEAKLCGADLSGADLRESNLEHADLSRADLRAANLWLAKTGGANFTGTLISDETVLPNGKTGSAQWAGEHGAMFAPVVAASKPEPEPAGVAGAASPQAVQSVSPSASSHAGSSATPQKATTLAKTLKPIRAWRPAPSSISYDADQLDQLKSNVTKWNRLRTEKPAMNVRLKEAPLDNRVLAYADLHGADLEKASLKRSDLEKADLNNANLRGADLRSANLQRADLRQADLRGANLWLANTGRAEFDGAIVSSETVLDTGKKATPAWAQEHAARFMDESEPLR